MTKQIILKPVITEKSVKLAEGGKYTFLVDAYAAKPQIRQAFKDTYGAEIVDISTVFTTVKRKKSFKRGRWVMEKYQRKSKKTMFGVKEGKDKIAKLFKF